MKRMHLVLRAVYRLYPRWWRRRYGNELEALVEDSGVTWPVVANLARGALAVRVRQRAPVEPATAAARSLFWTPSGFVPVLMSLGALTAIGVHILKSGIAPQADEGTAAHLWQLLMAGQLPFVAWFMVRWVPERGRRALAVSALHVGAIGAAVLPVWWLHW